MAIARDSTGNILLSASPHTINNAAGTFLIVSIGGGSAYASAVTYNGVSMTKTSHGDFASGGGYLGNIWYLASPATGSNSLAITGAGSFATQWVSYTGVDGGVDATSAVASGTGTSVSTSTTVVASNCWLVTATRFEGNATGGGTNNTQLQSSGNHFLGDSNTTVGTGAQTATTAGNSSAYRSATISISPTGGGGGTTYRRLGTLGVGQ